MEGDIQNYLSTVMFGGTPCTSASKTGAQTKLANK